MRYLLDNEKLTALKDAAGYSQSALARKIGISQPAMHALLQSPTDAKLSTVEALMDVLALDDMHALLSRYKGAPSEPPISSVAPGMLRA